MGKVKVLVTGGNGYIAKSLKLELEKTYEIVYVNRSHFDLTDSISVSNWFKNNTFDVVIHTAIAGGSRLKPDDESVIETNLKMYDNLEKNRHKFSKFISFGSGAELFLQTTPYGKSKIEIANRMMNQEHFYNIRIFGVFDENELNTRFIKANLNRYLKKEPIVIHTNKIMDFFYMKDLVSLVKFYIEKPNPPKTTNCSYKQKYSLSNIADIINGLGTHQVPVQVEVPNKLEFYCGDSNLPSINTVGLEEGIAQTYRSMLTK